MNRKYLTIATVVALAFVVVIPLLLRLDESAPATPGPESYAQLRHAELLSQGIFGSDPATGERFVPTPYHVLLVAGISIGVPWLLPILLSASLLFLIYRHLPAYVQDQDARMLALLVLAVSPVMSVFATHHAPALLALCLLLLGMRTRFGWPFHVLAIVTDPLLVSALLLVIIARALFQKDLRRAAILASALLVGAGWISVWDAMPLIRLDVSPLFFEFGAPQGISIFILIVAMYGLIEGKFSAVRVASVISMVLLTLFFPALLPATAVILAVFAGHGIANLLRGRWELDLLRQSLLILIACLGIFLLVVAARERLEEQPTAEFTRSMIYLSQQHREGKVLTDPHLSSLILAMTDREPVTASQGVFLSRDAERLYDFLEDSGTSYILITQEMRESFFSRSDEGILFLLPNTERFVLVHVNDENQIWYYIRR